MPTELTTSTLFLDTLVQAGITHAFVNWGSDHPGILEDLARQRQLNNGQTALKIVTCPNEMVALSAAQGFAQSTGRPAVVIVHVDVGTQALAGAVHNADKCRAPVLIYAGASPFTNDGDVRGSRNEFIMWLQDVPDQTAIVRQYMRYTGQIYGSKNVRQVVLRALQSAMSEPKGPVYVWARREAMEEVIPESSLLPTFSHRWSPIAPAALNPTAVETICNALREAASPLIITSYLGRNPEAVEALSKFSSLLAIPILVTCPSTVNIPFSHPNFVDLSYAPSPELVANTDVILIIDSDVPYIPNLAKPDPEKTRIFHIDVDPLKDNIGMFHVDAELRCKADGETALTQLLSRVYSAPINPDHIKTRTSSIRALRSSFCTKLFQLEQTYPSDGTFTVPNLLASLRDITSNIKTLVLNEAISSYPLVWTHLQPERLGSMFTSGASSLGWGLGASIGAILGVQSSESLQPEVELTILIVGDGSFLFGVPSSAYWIARKYGTPFLTIVINNGGWNSPKQSLLRVYPSGIGAQNLSGDQLSTGFGPHPPNYCQIAAGAGGAWGTQVSQVGELKAKLQEAVDVVLKERRCAVVDCLVEQI